MNTMLYILQCPGFNRELVLHVKTNQQLNDTWLLPLINGEIKSIPKNRFKRNVYDLLRVNVWFVHLFLCLYNYSRIKMPWVQRGHKWRRFKELPCSTVVPQGSDGHWAPSRVPTVTRAGLDRSFRVCISCSHTHLKTALHLHPNRQRWAEAGWGIGKVAKQRQVSEFPTS